MIEPRNAAQEIVLNEHAKATQAEVLEAMREALGHYKLFEEGAGDETEFSVSERHMQQKSVEQFGRKLERLLSCLKDEDYEDEGVLDLVQLKEAITSECEDTQIVDYLLYYVFVRSESASQMQYEKIIAMLDDAVNQQPSKRKARPESTSPEKLKQRNPSSGAGGIKNLK